MASQLNAFQLHILIELNKLPLGYQDFELIKSAWLADDLKITEELLNGWEKELIAEEYVETAEVYNPLYNISVWKPSLHPKIKIDQKGRDYLASLPIVIKEPAIKTENQLSVNPNIEIIIEHIGCLKGTWNRNKIMKDEEYKRLIEYTSYLIVQNEIPSGIIRIPQTNISNAFLRKTFHGLYKHFKQTANRETWVFFLHEVFQQFTCEISTTLAKFSRYVDLSNYETDKNSIE